MECERKARVAWCFLYENICLLSSISDLRLKQTSKQKLRTPNKQTKILQQNLHDLVTLMSSQTSTNNNF